MLLLWPVEFSTSDTVDLFKLYIFMFVVYVVYFKYFMFLRILCFYVFYVFAFNIYFFMLFCWRFKLIIYTALALKLDYPKKVCLTDWNIGYNYIYLNTYLVSRWLCGDGSSSLCIPRYTIQFHFAKYITRSKFVSLLNDNWCKFASLLTDVSLPVY